MLFLYYAILLLVVNSPPSNAELEDGVVVKLNEPNSRIRGHILRSYNGNDYYSFQDVPYALPPVGNLRFQESRPHTGWDGILNTTTNTKRCFQVEGGVEDCLTLNVYSPVKPGTAKLPVFFYIHGGALLTGYCGIDWCGPDFLMDYGIVVVTIHYRVGALGFLTTEDGVIPGNLGLKDQLLALKWVNKNIAVFGGDPTQVTIGGQSAGAVSVSGHILSQKATGLFRAAIMESGTALLLNTYESKGRDMAFLLGKILQPSFNGSSSELLKLLQSVPAEAIRAACKMIKPMAKQLGILENFEWSLVVEKFGKNPYLTQPFHQSLMDGKFEKVPILIGFTSEEILFFVYNIRDVAASAVLHDKNVSSIVCDEWNVPQQNVTIVGEKLKAIYTNETFGKDLASYVAFSSDTTFVNPTVRQAALSAKDVPVYLYEFCYKGIAHEYYNVSIPNCDGAGHSEELYYLWKMKELKTDSDKAFSRKTLLLWTNFIKSLNPTPNNSDPDLSNFSWPTVTDLNNIAYANISETLSVNYNPKKYNAVIDLFEKYARPPFNVL